MQLPLVLALVALIPPVGEFRARAQEPGALPKAETVLADFIKATGGEEAYKKLKSRSLSGTLEVSGANVSGKVQIFQAAPNQISVTTEIPNVLKQVQATDGKDAWELNNVAGDRLLAGEEKDEFIRRAVFNEELHKKELNDKIECVGIENVEGKPAYKIVLTAKGGKSETEYYDKSTHLLVKEIATAKSPMGEITIEVFPSDYKKVDGLLIPFTVTQKTLNQQLKITMTEIKHNVEIPADTFRRPASLDAAEKKKAE
jgi:zinc protease